eukprot:359761-Chlamydomonas_euryale.AAC.2
MDVYRAFVLPTFLYGCETWTLTELQMGRQEVNGVNWRQLEVTEGGTWTWTELQMGRLEVTQPHCLRRIVSVKPTGRHRLDIVRERCGTSSLEWMVRRRTLQSLSTDCKWTRIACRGRFFVAH